MPIFESALRTIRRATDTVFFGTNALHSTSATLVASCGTGARADTLDWVAVFLQFVAIGFHDACAQHTSLDQLEWCFRIDCFFVNFLIKFRSKSRWKIRQFRWSDQIFMLSRVLMAPRMSCLHFSPCHTTKLPCAAISPTYLALRSEKAPVEALHAHAEVLESCFHFDSPPTE